MNRTQNSRQNHAKKKTTNNNKHQKTTMKKKNFLALFYDYDVSAHLSAYISIHVALKSAGVDTIFCLIILFGAVATAASRLTAATQRRDINDGM